MFNNKQIRIVGIVLIIILLNLQILISFGITKIHFYKTNPLDGYSHDLKNSDVAGSELYSEQISAYVAGAKSIIQQSLFTNDSNIFPNMDFNDPAFFRCSMMLTASNGKLSEMFPSILSDNIFGSQLLPSYNSFFGFLFYENEIEIEDAQKRAERAFEIIKNAFEIELFTIETSEENFFPFIGYYPNWKVVLNRIYTNLPKDGYWKALDIERLSSDDYLNNNYLSCSILLLNSLEMFFEGINITSSQFNYDFSDIDLSFLDTFGFAESTEEINDSEDILGGFGEFLDIGDSNQTFTDFFENIFAPSGGLLQENNRYITMLIQYEGNSEGITKTTGPDKYIFDLFKALGYNDTTLYPSEKIFIALIGTFLCEIDINILSTDIISVSPQNFQISDNIIEDLAEAIWIADIDFDIYTLKNYEFETNWVNVLGVNQLYTLPINPTNESNIINFLEIIGYKGLPYLLTGLLNPVESIVVRYSTANSEPTLKIIKTAENASYGFDHTFQINITAQNVGNITAWAIPTKLPVDFEELLDAAFFIPGSRDEIEDYFEESLITLLNLDEDPRLFHFDSNSDGITDMYYPDISTISNIFPYNEEFVQYLEDHPVYFIYAGVFNNPNSIYNEENWKLVPGESISLTLTNLSIEDLDEYTPFTTCNFIETEEVPLPAINYGSTHPGSDLSNAHIQDGINWVIDSEEKIIDYHIIDIDFVFENKSYIDLTNNTLNRVRIYINTTSDGSPDEVSFQFYNFTSENLEEINATSYVNNTYTFEFIDDEINGLFDPESSNHTLFFNAKFVADEAFNLSIDSIYVNFSFREIVPVPISPALVSYSNENGIVTYSMTSNSLVFSTYNMSSILVTSSLESYSSFPGQENRYFIELTNIGSMNAEDVNFSLPIPGIIKEKNSFQVFNSTIIKTIPEIKPNQTIKLNFTFYTPNSIIIPNCSIKFKNPKILYENQSSITVQSNELFLSAPIDYEINKPFLRVIQIKYSTNNTHPQLNDFINLSINISNQGPAFIDVTEIEIEISEDIEGLKRKDNKTLKISDLSWKETKNVSMILQKTSYKGYLYPPINVIIGSESSTIRIEISQPIVLGYIDFQITKNVTKKQRISGEELQVTLKVVNVGNIGTKNFSLNDINSYFQQQFHLVEGILVHDTQSLELGESFSTSYTIIGKGQGIYNLSAAFIEYYYLTKKCAESNSIQMKIILHPNIQKLAIIIPSVICLFIIGSYGFFKYKYRADIFEKKRKEDEILSASKFDEILSHKGNLIDSLDRLNTYNEGGAEN